MKLPVLVQEIFGFISKIFFARYKKRLLEQLGEEGCEHINLVQGDSFEVVSWSYELKWLPWPTFVLNKQVIAKGDMGMFCSYLFSGQNNQYLDGLKKLLAQDIQERFKNHGQEAINAYLNKSIELIEDKLFKFKQHFIDNKTDICKNVALDIISRTSRNSLLKFKRSMSELNQTEIEEWLNLIKEDLIIQATKLFGAFFDGFNPQKSLQIVKVLPPNTRLYVPCGNHQIFVIEQMPSTRTVSVSQSLSESDKTHFSLAFPYVVFIVILENGEFDDMKVFYRNKELKKLNNKLFHTNLSNVNDECEVCLNFDGESHKNEIATVNSILNYFWGSTFNSDLSDYFKFYARAEESLSSFDIWEENSVSCPDFPLSIKWEEADTLGSVLSELVEKYTGAGSAFEAITESLNESLEGTMDNVVLKIKQKMSTIEIGSKHFSSNIQIVQDYFEDSLNEMKELVEGAISEIFSKSDRDEQLLSFLATSIEAAIKSILRSEHNIEAKSDITLQQLIYKCKTGV